MTTAATATKPLIRLENIDFQQTGTPLLCGVNCQLLRNEIVGLLGMNGAGKSTTLKILAGRLSSTRGNRYCCSSLHIGFAPEKPPFIPGYTVRRFLQHIARIHGMSTSTQSAAIARVIDWLDLKAIVEKTCTTLSKGNQQRVNLAQALLAEPDVLILDEPTSGLDTQQMASLRRTLLSIKPNTAIVLSSHLMHEVMSLCDRAIVIDRGQQLGELDLSRQRQRFVIEFNHPVAEHLFTDCAVWHSGCGQQHQFYLDQQQSKQAALAFCLGKQLGIARVIDLHETIEQQFLAMINQPVSHA